MTSRAAATATRPVADAAERSLVPAVSRAVEILDLIGATNQPIGVSAISRALALPKSSVANLCTTLVESGMLRPVAGGFALGPRLARLGAAYLAGVDQVALFHDACERVTAGRDETAQLATLGDGMDVVYLARRDGAFAVRLASAPGVALPASCTATGKAMLASLAPDQLDARLAGAGRLPRLTASSITSVRALRAELDAVRSAAVAIDREEVIEGVVCLAVAIPAVQPVDLPLAVSFTLLAPRATPATCARLTRALHDLAGSIAAGLGAAPLDREDRR